MFPQLPAQEKTNRFSVSGLGFAMCVRSRMLHRIGTMARRRVVFVELLGAVRTFEFVAFARNARQSHDHEKQGKKFHRGAS